MTQVSRDTYGEVQAKGRVKMPLPTGEAAVYFLTSAQNNTSVHPQLWANLHTYSGFRNGRVMVGSFTYNKSAHVKDQKKTSREVQGDDEWWDEAVLPYLVDERVELAPGLVWCGELQILPTAVNPISGLESYTGRDSTIIPHVKFAMRSIASPKGAGTKLIYTSGTVTLRNYIQKKAGQKAEFHHGYGALIVEVTPEGDWFVRQINADSEGTFYDLDYKVENGVVTQGHRPEAIVWGDIHARHMEKDIEDLAWGDGGILDTLRPLRQVFHDTLDFRSRNHHDAKDSWKGFQKFIDGQGSVETEVDEAACFLANASRPWCESLVVASNHDQAFERWLKEADFRLDPENAPFFLKANFAAYSAMQRQDRNFYSVEWAFQNSHIRLAGVRFLRDDEEYIVCPDAGGGIELAMHGHRGANGAKGSLAGFARTGRKCIVADSHVAGIQDGAYQVGVMGSLDQGYNKGQSAWSHTNAIVYPNGKRTLFTIWKGRWHG